MTDRLPSTTRSRFVGTSGLRRFQQAIDGLLVEQAVSAAAPMDGFEAGTTQLALAQSGVLWANIPALRSRRDPGSGRDDKLFLLWCSKGSGLLRHRRGTESLDDENLVLIPGDAAFEVSYATRSRPAFVTLSGPVLETRYATLRDEIRSVPLHGNGLPVLPAVLAELEIGLDSVTGLDAGVIESLLHNAVTVSVGRVADRSDDRRALLRLRIHRFIEQAADPAELSPALVAERLFVSLRQLHRAFEGTRTTVADLIRRRRLDEAAALLRHGSPGLGVTEIAHLSGFATGSHLASWFRRSYAMSPSEYREMARIERPMSPM